MSQYVEEIEALERDIAMGLVRGSNLQYSTATTKGQVQSFAAGTKNAPDTSLNPLLKASRTLSLLSANVSGDAVEQASVGEDITIGTTSNQIQTVGRAGIAANEGESKGATDSPDACGIYGVGRILTSGIGVGMGAFFRGESQTNTGRLSSIQIQAFNKRGVEDTELDTAFPNSSAIWIWADGPNQSSQAITIGNATGTQFDAGIVLNGQEAGGKTGGIASTGIRCAGSYSKAAISVKQGSGPVILGASETGFATAQLDVVNNAAADPVSLVRSLASSNVSFQLQNSVGGSKYFAAGGENAILTGTTAGDTGIKVNTAAKTFHIGGTISTIKVNQGNELGFYNVAPVKRAAAIPSPAAELAALKTAVDAIREAIKKIGITE